jgi:imidazolonepropionase-like amidohydrolase
MSTPTRRTFLGLAKAAVTVAAIWVPSLDAQERAAVTLIENVRIFDGTHPSLSAPSSVLIRGNIIEQISTSPISTDHRADTQTIAGGGRVLMPGLIDAHWHAMMLRSTPAQMLSSHIGYSTLQAGAEAIATLDRSGHGRAGFRP